MECPQYSIRLEARADTSFTVCRRFRHIAVLTFAVLVCRRFDHTPTSSCHAHLDRQRYDMACRVTRERASDVAENFGRFIVWSIQSRGMILNSFQW